MLAGHLCPFGSSVLPWTAWRAYPWGTAKKKSVLKSWLSLKWVVSTWKQCLEDLLRKSAEITEGWAVHSACNAFCICPGKSKVVTYEELQAVARARASSNNSSIVRKSKCYLRSLRELSSTSPCMHILAVSMVAKLFSLSTALPVLHPWLNTTSLNYRQCTLCSLFGWFLIFFRHEYFSRRVEYSFSWPQSTCGTKQ